MHTAFLSFTHCRPSNRPPQWETTLPLGGGSAQIARRILLAAPLRTSDRVLGRQLILQDYLSMRVDPRGAPWPGSRSRPLWSLDTHTSPNLADAPSLSRVDTRFRLLVLWAHAASGSKIDPLHELVAPLMQNSGRGDCSVRYPCTPNAVIRAVRPLLADIAHFHTRPSFPSRLRTVGRRAATPACRGVRGASGRPACSSPRSRRRGRPRRGWRRPCRS